MAWGAAFAALVSYASLLRPAVRVDAGALILRNMIDTNVIPLALIDEVVVRQVLVVRAAEKRYVSPAIGNSFFRTIRPKTARDGETELTYPDYVRDRILHLADGARRRAGSGDLPPVRRLWAWPEIAGLAVTALGFAGRRSVLRARDGLASSRQMPRAALTSPLMASSRPAAAIRAASTPSSGCTGMTTSR